MLWRLLWILGPIIAIILMIVVQNRFLATADKWKRIQNNKGMTGAEVAKKIFEMNNITDVKIVAGINAYGDNYNPSTKTITLSPDVFNGTSLTAAAIAAHEVGHAIQYKVNYFGIRLRNLFLPAAQGASQLSWVALMIGMVLMIFPATRTTLGTTFILAGIITIAIIALFQLITLPVEFDASKRAKENLNKMNIVVGADQANAVKRVLNAAAMTYVISLVVTLIELLRWIIYLALNDN